MSGPRISLGLGAKNLKDHDWIGVSDPYVVVSRPNENGGFTNIRTSETKMNTLNPRWNDFLFDAHELNGNDKELKLMFQIYDDDGKKGADAKDKLIGTGYFNLKELEAACMMQAPLAISDGKRSKPAGYLIVNSYKEHGAAQGPPGAPGAPGGGYQGGYGGAPNPSYPAQPGPGYPSGGYPGGNPPSNPYTGPQGGYPGGQGGYPSNQGGYPAQAGGYPGGAGGYPPNAGGYPPNAGGYPGGNPGNPGGYPGNPGGYPGNPGGYPPNPRSQGGFPGGDPMFPPSNLPPGPGAGGFMR